MGGLSGPAVRRLLCAWFIQVTAQALGAPHWDGRRNYLCHDAIEFSLPERCDCRKGLLIFDNPRLAETISQGIAAYLIDHNLEIFGTCWQRPCPISKEKKEMTKVKDRLIVALDFSYGERGQGPCS